MLGGFDGVDPGVVDRYERVSDAESFAMTRRLAREEGLLVGGSSGMAVVAALRTATGGRDVVVDGEIVALDGGRPSFSRLQRRMHTPRPRRPLVAEVPAAFYVFDLLEVHGQDIAALTYLERRQLLGEVVTSAGAVQVTPYWPGADPAAMVAMAAEFGLEGVVAKRSSSVYRRGLRSPSWIKVPLRATVRRSSCAAGPAARPRCARCSWAP